jgi:hypothetical protein
MPRILDQYKDITGHVQIVMYDSEGNIKQTHESHNTITEIHNEYIADLVANGSPTVTMYGHAGEGSGATCGDTNLDTPFAEARTGMTSVTQGTGADDNDVVFVFTLGAGICTGTITEFGLFESNTYTNADMHAYYDDGGGFTFTKGAGDTITVTWTITYGSCA